MKERARKFFSDLQDEICLTLENLDGKAKFQEDNWERSSGGGGRTRVVTEGNIFEKGGVNFSFVFGKTPEKLANQIGSEDFLATGISLVLHPQNPMIPTVHANFRYLETLTNGKQLSSWFGGGMDLTPYYPYREDAEHFHKTLKNVCDKHSLDYYPRYKKWCDEYFFLPHRNESRGIGGLFFDYLKSNEETSLENIFDFVKDVGKSFLPAYVPIVEKRSVELFSESERKYQLIRRGRYAEFNLIYDRGTSFGLATNGRTESILMSLPPVVNWVYDYKPQPGSREEKALEFFKPQDWLL